MKGKRVLAALTGRLDSGRVLEPSTRAGAEEAFAPHPLTTVINDEVRVGPKTEWNQFTKLPSSLSA